MSYRRNRQCISTCTFSDYRSHSRTSSSYTCKPSFLIKNIMFLPCLYFKETQRNVYMCLLPLSESQTIFIFPTMSHSSSLQFQVNWFYCAFHFPCKKKVRVLFSTYSYIVIFSTYTYILLLLQYNLSSSHSTQTPDKNLLNWSPEFSSTVTENKAFSSLQFQKGTTSFSNKHG